MTLLKYFVYVLSCTMIILCIGSCINNENSAQHGTVIIINGPSSVGKTSIIKAFQAKQSVPWLSIGIDNFFVGLIHPKFYLDDKPEHRLVMHGVSSEDKKGKLFVLNVGHLGQKIINGMHLAIADYARAGNNVIVDYIKYEDAWLARLQAALRGIKVVWIGVNASLELIQQREKKRGTSPEGHARSIYYTVHNGMTYDLMLDNSHLTPEQAADYIIKFMKEKKLM